MSVSDFPLRLCNRRLELTLSARRSFMIMGQNMISLCLTQPGIDILNSMLGHDFRPTKNVAF